MESEIFNPFFEEEKQAMARFARLYLNTGCDEEEADEVAETTYRRCLASNAYSMDAAITCLDLESFRYEDM